MKQALDRSRLLFVVIGRRYIPGDAGPARVPVACAVAGEGVYKESHCGIDRCEWTSAAGWRNDQPARQVFIAQCFIQRNEALHLVSQRRFGRALVRGRRGRIVVENVEHTVERAKTLLRLLQQSARPSFVRQFGVEQENFRLLVELTDTSDLFCNNSLT